MKLTQTPSLKRKSGMTLLELTVVILVLLSLISILFIGARAWKKGSDRAGCILNLRNIQQAVRGDQNMKNKAPGGAVVFADIIGATGYITKIPTCPSTSVAYTYAEATKYPAVDTLYAACPNIATLTDHSITDTVGW
ncbi:MAG: prepilin-type N-terminal cleavage/methylation domain-containing protein [Verrucomicrobia bacterium]|nr:prepilin-type N-terminal cleavage/methylation domain-containing protein [Verrucomicrobiota bacterium]